ncbi:hypothetical protein, unlikely [Trypanosoma brucei gambiense DAL972]|uniref:Uncharacterized protein n=1 Tax=Trypanosoma brucei gambiense (strain MHOM/CI/86/DAL972) TaxID=679716 RepID=D0A6Q2_TRYB9|nr:hypothetical protein, unlikely [Trypanosoma brucei gambiense DAL972]CBH17353.1 hypothetical protein, unlikely [Trypanosoma brucei gambiense DAL972]|eukprot:XP_011779617.1 hypothetical protein, unlikely [Trypanosoma brucei gambiense DAL972]
MVGAVGLTEHNRRCRFSFGSAVITIIRPQYRRNQVEHTPGVPRTLGAIKSGAFGKQLDQTLRTGCGRETKGNPQPFAIGVLRALCLLAQTAPAAEAGGGELWCAGRRPTAEAFQSLSLSGCRT